MNLPILQEPITEQVVEVLKEDVWENIKKVFTETYTIGEHFKISLLSLVIIIITLILTRLFLKFATKFVSKRLAEETRPKFESLFTFAKYVIYAIVFAMVFNGLGINITPVLAASAALLVGVGLALQTLFQDILSGVFILVDQTVKVGDIIELDDKIGRVEEIKLRTTRAVTIDNKVLIIPNHQYLTNSLYNWTQNGTVTRDSVSVGVAYGSDVNLVRDLLLQAVKENERVLDMPSPYVFFSDFGDSSLNFKVMYTIKDSFIAAIPRSEIRFKIDELFRKHNIEIPFPQRVVHMANKETK